jgi:hypothetical protein
LLLLLSPVSLPHPVFYNFVHTVFELIIVPFIIARFSAAPVFYNFINTVFELIIVAFIIARFSAAPCIFIFL